MCVVAGGACERAFVCVRVCVLLSARADIFVLVVYVIPFCTHFDDCVLSVRLVLFVVSMLLMMCNSS